MMIEWFLKKTRSFRAWWQGLNCFGQKLPVILAFIFSIALIFHVFFEMWEVVCEAIRTDKPLAKIVLIILKHMIQETSSDIVLNMSMLLVVSIGWLFLYWQRNRFRKWIIRYWNFKHRTLLEPLVFSIAAASIFIYFFGKKLLMEMDQDIMRNLILLTAGVVGWYFLYQRTKTADQSKKATEQSAETAEESLTVERFTRAVEQIANEDSSVRLGGILGLKQIAKTHEEERKKVARILVSFIRTQAAKNSKRSKDDLTKSGFKKLEDEEEFSAYRARRLDIESAVNALANVASELEEHGEFQEKYDKMKYHLCDLQNTDLRGLRFVETDLSKFNFAGANMSGISLTSVDLSGVRLYGSKEETKFIGAFLEDINFSEAHLNFANFQHANLKEVNFLGACLDNTNFSKTEINKAVFKNATLKDADFSDAKLIEVSDLLQWKLDEAFRRKGHHTKVTSANGISLDPPPER